MKRFKSLLVVLPLFVFFLGLVFRIPSRVPVLWFSLLVAAILFYAIASRVKKRKFFTILTLLSTGLFIAGFIEFSGLTWLHMAYIPYVLLVAVFFPPLTLLIVSLSIPFLEVRHLFYEGRLHEELSLLGFVAITSAVAFLWRQKSSIQMTRAKTADSVSDLKGKGLDKEPDDEIKDILKTVMFTVMPDAVSLFLFSGGELSVRCSTDDSVELLADGIPQEAIARRQTVVLNSVRKRNSPLGYIRRGRVSSVVASPVMDGRFVLGVLVADSRRTGAFTGADVKAVELFSNQIARVLQRQRIHAEIERSHTGLKVLHDESSRLITSLDLDSVVQNTIEGVRRIAPLSIAFFLKSDRSYELMGTHGFDPPDKRKFSLRNTVAEVALKNRQQMYVSNTRGYKLPILPFDAGSVASTLILPLFYEEEILGVVVLLSGEINPLSSYQIELLEVLCNQATISLKNAMLHAEIKRKAITDGLTGLFNHRHFQEKFNKELNRFKRFPRPFSLLLIDIDYFKKINDTYGHPAGDAVLKGVARIIKKTLRDIDVPARYGGEEFATILVGADKQEAVRTAERLRTNIMTAEFDAEGNKISVTVSVGIATCPEDAKVKEDIIDRADKALYHAKETGRNKVVAWTETLGKA
jgi:diguanylate cyclase (GGDEF)-like protein